MAQNAETSHFDAIVVGGGVIGCSVAYHLSLAGCRTAVLERGAFGGGASSANPGSIALSSKKPGLSLRMAIASRLIYETLTEELGANLEFTADGNVTVARTTEELDFISAMAEQQRAAGVPANVVSADECRRMNWLLRGAVAGGVHCAVDAHTNPFLVTTGFARAAAARGARLHASTEVKSIERERPGRFRVVTDRGGMTCDFLVNATGLDAPRIGAMLGLEHHVLPRAGHVMALDAPGELPLVKTVSASQLMAKHGGADGPGIALSYTRKPHSGTVLLGGSNQLGVASKEISPDILSAICAYGAGFMPDLERMNVIRAWVGLRPYSPDGPVLGRRGAPGTYLAAFGHGGDGMALAPVTGRYIAELVCRHPVDPTMDDFLETQPGRSELEALSARSGPAAGAMS